MRRDRTPLGRLFRLDRADPAISLPRQVRTAPVDGPSRLRQNGPVSLFAISAANAWEGAFLPIFLAALTGGLAAGVLTTLTRRYTLKVDEEFEQRAKTREAEAARRDRMEQAHAAAATTFAERVAEVYRILDCLAWTYVGEEMGVYSPESCPPMSVTDAGSAIALLRDVWTAHPTANVRQTAR